VSLALSVVAALMTTATPAAAFRAAIVVGVNESFTDSQANLRYADDDAARYAELLSAHVDHLELLTVLDEDSQEVFVDAARSARVPTEAGLMQALNRARARAKSARILGRRTELYFVYIGHGRVQGGVGQVRLLGGQLDRPTLAQQVLSDALFDRKHLVVDACSAYMLVNARGEAEPDVDAAFERFFEAQTLDQYPDVGAVLATSGIGPTHEWSRYQGGVFSHELRSALTGAADVNRDGRVDYLEVEAFVAAANFEVPALKGRPRVYVRSPRIERGAALMEIDASLPALELPKALKGHYVVEDRRGLRYAELHKEAGFVMALSLLPAHSYALRDAEGAELLRIEAPSGRLRVAMPLEPGPVLGWARGDDAPPGLFARPFGPDFSAGYAAQWKAAASARLAASPPSRAQTWVRPVSASVVGALGLTAAVLSIWQNEVAKAHYEDYQGAFSRPDRDAAQASASASRRRSVGFAVGAGVGVLTAVGLLIL